MTDAALSAPLLQIKNLSVAFRQGKQQREVVSNVSLDIRAGETLALVGESGSGKSVTALSVLRLLPSSVVYPQGDILFAGQSLLNADASTLRQIRGNQISMIFQEPMVSLNPLHTIEKQLTEVLTLHRNLHGDAARTEILRCLDRVGIRQAASRLRDFPHQLSGGERQRVMIAMAVLTRPKLLIADEPTTALDVSVQAQILSLLDELKQEMGMAMLFITHNLRIVRRLADTVAVMQHGRVVEQQSRTALFSQPQHPYTCQLLQAEPQGRPQPLTGKPPVLLDVKNLDVGFPVKRGLLRRTVGIKHAVNQVSFQLRRGESLGVVGESGSGKSTTGLALLRLLKSQGEIWFDGQPLHAFSRKKMLPFRSRIQVVFQDPFSALNPRFTVGQIIAEGLLVHRNVSEQARDKAVIRAMQEVGLDPQSRHRYPTEFSGGQRQRIAIARALILQPEMLILDEPTSSLDKSVQAQILTILSELQQRHGLTYLFISHDLHVVRALCHQLMVLRNGEVVEQGECEQIFTAPQQAYTRELLAASEAFDTHQR
ncbi:ABC transporter related protein [Rahnella aceris]|jgi:microcin C transport system ATP-binding protein|uniref:ABC transporter related protein n=1 Tax=Rahnella sp. (strain Y9602) TaxID=2703885 RepID=A0A0H3F7R4_RAHSY|nr:MULTISPECIES: microcin C ABC transporter ATP-binding protein YejF [Rahnella]AFE57517.1 microcin C ABC transporter ATP-binding protein YejF [Rahnella aquatilis HX2]ADW72943.1 ABC transporter related protein [Rahnella aceris]MBU9841296.1 microcin C ABC transporter ATP-binding protein YejF [Rahnella aceris]MBU9859584.1 microcin C ABC transporter ATP-binding protein YejF [Rahnella aceris]MCM2444187.1 microcin C ABC transporter ATP-binding protein YejF [Rahnella sp. CG8]